MENYKPLLVITLAFSAAVCSYIYYADHQSAMAENANRKLEKKQEKKAVYARHILVKDIELARELRKRVLSGEDFSELAGKFSLCPSAQKGGNLGPVIRGQTLPAFEQAAFALDRGEVSGPVQTMFGWHLINVTDIMFQPRLPGEMRRLHKP